MRLAEEAGVSTVVGLQRRFAPHNRYLSDLLRDGYVEPPEKVQHAGDDELRDRRTVDPRRVRDEDVGARDPGVENVPHARRGRVHPAQ